MKNHIENLCFYHKKHNHYIHIMKLMTFFLFVLIFQLYAGATYSQNEKLSLNMNNVTVEEVINQIEKNTQFKFVFTDKAVDTSREVSIHVSNGDITEALNQLMRNTDLEYKVVEKLIVLSEKTPAITQQIKQIKVSGSVLDENSEPIIGANVREKGTNNGVITDVEGKYSIMVPGDATLVISYIGFTGQDIDVSNRTNISVVLHENALALEEVVVVGYGTMKKSDLTGSIVSLKMADKEIAANVSLAQALQGYMAGVNVGGAARAGESGSISIRGQTSLSASEEPLLVIDGIIYNGSLSDIDVNDIEKVDILKDASAAAVYGSRSANGVIIITTKKGQSDKPLFNFNMYHGFQEMAPTPRIKVMNGDEFAIRLVDFNYYQQELLPWYQTNPTGAAGRPARPDITDRNLVAKSLRTLEEQENYLANREVDWMNEVNNTAPIRSYNLSVSGKTNRTNYYLSGAYVGQDGIIDGDDFKRFTLRANFENKITDWFSIGLNTSLSRLDYSGYYNNTETVSWDGFYNTAAMTHALRASPLANPVDAKGNYPISLANETAQRHPLLNSYVDDKDIANRLFFVLSAKVDIPFVKGLRYEINYSETFNTHKQNNFFPTTTFEGSSFNNYGEKNLTEGRDWLINNIVSYSNTFNDVHSINGTLLYSAEKRTGESSKLVSYGFQNPILGYNALHLGETQSVTSGAWEEASISYMGRVNYAYDNKYLLTATYRRDGFSGFGNNTKYAGFPSVSAAWVLSRENFLNEVNWLDQLKLRLSYGKNGNQGVGRYASLSKVESAPYVFDANPAVGVYPTTMGNSDLGWESTTSTNLGVDIIVVDQRISAEIDVYNAKTDNVLVKRNIPQLTGYSSVWTNMGKLRNKGIEIALSSVNFKRQDFRWQSRVLFSLNRDEITELYGGENDYDIGNSWFKGEPIKSIYNYVVDGVWQEEDLFNGTIMPGYYPGMYRVRSLNGDDVIDANNDRKIVGNKSPNYRFGINNTFTYKGFAFSFFLNSIQGGNGFYTDDAYDIIAAAGANPDFAIRSNRPSIYPYWRPDNPVNNVPAIYYAPPQNPGYYMSRSFVRLQDVSLSYDLGKKALSKIKLNSLQFYVSGKNLYTWTNWPGWDPEDDNTPLMRSIIGGIKVSF
jgi:TonB-linked SusC/RagA family outer membrane protein